MELTMSPTTIPIDHLTINERRLHQTIAELAAIGALPTGGVQRLAFSQEDAEARIWVQRRMRAIGMATTIDAAGNLIGRYPGHCSGAPAIATGSHIDTVPDGGISHAAAEYTTPEHCVQGANLLLHTLIQLDQHYRCQSDTPAVNQQHTHTGRRRS